MRWPLHNVIKDPGFSISVLCYPQTAKLTLSPSMLQNLGLYHSQTLKYAVEEDSVSFWSFL